MKIGISGFHPELTGHVDFFEIDALDSDGLRLASQFHIPILLSANHFYFSHRDPEVFRGRVIQLSEMCHQFGSEVCLLKLPPAFRWGGDDRYPLHRLIRIWKEYSSVPLIFDATKNHTAAELKRISTETGWDLSLDPMWIKPFSNICWKIHGWHDGRWIRLYPESSLIDLWKSCRKWNPRFLIFGHSQRSLQVLQFLALREKNHVQSKGSAEAKNPNPRSRQPRTLK